MSERRDELDWPLRSEEDFAPRPPRESEPAREYFDEPPVDVRDEAAPAVEEEPEPEPEPEPAPKAEAAPEPEPEPAAEPEAEPEEPEPAATAEHALGEFRVPGDYRIMEGAPHGERRTVAIVVSRFNADITNRLLENALDALAEAGVARDAILVMPVPGAFELPLAAMALAKTRRYACVVALGCIVRGETPHFEYVASEAASGLQLAAIETGIPVSFGVLTCDTVEQAEARVDRGADAARTALEMADLFSQLRAAAAGALR